jgi:hypothetical protein
MPDDRSPSRRLLAAKIALGALAILAALLLGLHASPPRGSMEPDRSVYLAIAERPLSHAPMVRQPPWCWRVLPSLLVWASGLDPRTGFALLTLVSAALFPAAIVSLLIALRVSTISAVAMGGVAALAPPITGYLSWCYPMTDAFALLLTSVAVGGIIAQRDVRVAVCLPALALTKETWTLTAVFAVLWPRGDRRLSRLVLASIAAALVLAIAVRLAIRPDESYSPVGLIAHYYWPIDPRNIARRLLLATGATWNVLLPLAAALLVRLRGMRIAVALAMPVALSTAQILFAKDTPRPVAAAYPFVMVAAAMELDRLAPRLRAAASMSIVVAQIPWLLTYAWVVRLPLRGVEIGLVIATLALGVALWRSQRPAAVTINP